MKIYLLLLLTGLFSCLNNNTKKAGNSTTSNFIAAQEKMSVSPAEAEATVPAAKKHFQGALTGGFKGDQISFDLSADGKKLENLTFKGYWRCSGKLEQISAVGPDGFFPVNNGVAKGHISDPPEGGSTAWRFDIDVKITGKNATGTFRMNINNLGCDTYLLKFTATAK